MNELGLLPGMAVRSADGTRLGRVKHVREDGTIEIGRRLFAPHECLIAYEDVACVRGDYVVLKHGATPEPVHSEADSAPSVPVGREGEARPRQLPLALGLAEFDTGAEVPFGEAKRTVDDPVIPYKLRLRESGVDAIDYPSHEPSLAVAASLRELRIPLAEEQVRVERQRVPAGEVRIHKTVVSQPRMLSVPVTIETVRVERIPASEGLPDFDAGSAFKEETITVPVRQEHVELVKHPVIREEVLVAREDHEEEVELETEVRREELTSEESLHQ